MSVIKIFKIVVYIQHFGRWWKKDSMPREQDLGVRTGWSPRHLSLLEVLLLINFYLYRLLARWGKMFKFLKIQNKTKQRKCAKQSARKLENELQWEIDSKTTSSAKLLWYAGWELKSASFDSWWRERVLRDGEQRGKGNGLNRYLQM